MIIYCSILELRKSNNQINYSKYHLSLMRFVVRNPCTYYAIDIKTNPDNDSERNHRSELTFNMHPKIIHFVCFSHLHASLLLVIIMK